MHHISVIYPAHLLVYVPKSPYDVCAPRQGVQEVVIVIRQVLGDKVRFLVIARLPTRVHGSVCDCEQQLMRRRGTRPNLLSTAWGKFQLLVPAMPA